MDDTPELREASSDLVVHAARLVRAVRRLVAQPAGIRVLSLLDEHGALGITQLAELDRCAQPTMSGAVGHLVEQGWAAKQPHPDDARASLVSLTDRGRETLARYRREYGEAIAARLLAHGRHSDADLATAVAVLRDVLDADPSLAMEGSL
ncbi:MAG TPA: MarR family transcriptional regulator [Nocardioidaceae bacterium]|nr:MarR family transcriptional regulator [Nocardioidaceae bacterium]